jgi:FKBP12-rapamycin complex-associated protein
MLVTRTLGRLAKASASTTSKTLTAEWVEFESKRALEWLEGDRHKDDGRRYASVLVLKELAENAPTLFYTHVSNFLIHIWNGIHDPSIDVREGSIQALRAVLALVSERSSTGRVEWYHDILSKVKSGFKSKQPESIHGSLLATGELLRNTGKFMTNEFDEICNTVLGYSDHREKMIRRAVIILIPELAKFNKTKFVENYLSRANTIILNYIKAGFDRNVAYIAIGELAIDVGGEHIRQYLDAIISTIKDGLTSKRGRPFVPEALTCAARLAKSVGELIKDHLLGLLDQMFSAGLSTTLTQALADIVEEIPSLLGHIQERLLDLISIILTRSPYTVTNKIFSPPPIEYNTETIALALHTLGTFNTKGHNLADFCNYS